MTTLVFTPDEIRTYYQVRVPGLRQTDSRQWRGPCPVHGGKNDNFVVEAENGLAHCFSSCSRGWDVIGLERELSGRDFKEARAEILRIVGRPSINGMKPGNDVFYDYLSEAGALVFQVVRTFRSGRKGFYQRRPDGHGGWINGTKGVRRLLYQLDRLVVGAADRMVFLTEGEKDCRRLGSLGLLATTNPGGAGKWRSEYIDNLVDRHVAILPDNDDPGRKHALDIAKSLIGKAASVRVIELSGLGNRGDVSDWLNAGHEADELQNLAENTPNLDADGLDELEERWGFGSTQQRSSCSELQNAERLVRQHGQDLRFCSAFNAWLIWDGTRWKRDDRGLVVLRAKRTVRGIYREAAAAKDLTERNKLSGWACRSERAAQIAGMLKLAESEPAIPISAEELDTQAFLLNCRNGVVDLKTGDRKPHERNHLITKLAPVEFNPDAQCPRWERFLEEVFEPHPDIIEFMQRAIGYTLTGDVREECLFLLHGSGRNEKGVLLKTIEAALADYACTADFSAFIQNRNDSGPRDDIANMCGRRLVISQEAREGAAFAESLLKWLTGGDRVRARRLYENSFEFDPTFKIWLATNHRPEIRGNDPGIWSRIKLIPFDVSFEGREDRSLKATLRAELPGILAWAVRGCLDWQHDGLQFPESITTATEEYRHESDQVGRFIDDRCVTGEFATAKGRPLYSEYKKWAADAGEDVLSETAFGRRLTERGFDKKRTSGGNEYQGIGLRADRAE